MMIKLNDRKNLVFLSAFTICKKSQGFSLIFKGKINEKNKKIIQIFFLLNFLLSANLEWSEVEKCKVIHQINW